MSFNITSSFVSRSIVEDNKEKSLKEDDEANKEEVVIQEHYDPRTLYERLQEQRTIKEEKFAEESRLSNQIKRVDAEEVEYFKTLADEKEKLEYQRKINERLELEEFRQAVGNVRSSTISSSVDPSNTSASTLPISIKPKPLPKSKRKNSLKSVMMLKKKRTASDSEGEEEKEGKEEETKPDIKKQKKESDNGTGTKASAGALSLLSAYGDASDSDSD